MSSTLHTLVTRLRAPRSPGGQPPAAGEITTLILEQVRLGEMPAYDLYPAVFSYVVRAERELVRESERAGLPDPGDTGSSEQGGSGQGDDGTGPQSGRSPGASRPYPYVNIADEAMKNLLAQTCYVPGHGLVPWGELTAELHRLRIGYLQDRKRRIVDGINATVRRHQVALALLTESACADLDSYWLRFGALPQDLRVSSS